MHSVLVLGSGGREHALGRAMVRSGGPLVLHFAPGNAGTALIGTNHSVSITDPDAVLHLVTERSIDLVVVGPEAPLVAGVANRLRSSGISVVGPDADLAHLEGSKVHAKAVMQTLGIPTADHIVARSRQEVEAALSRFEGAPWVVKRDVLAGGKGVTVSSDREEAFGAAMEAIESDGCVLIEAHLPGEEASMLVLMDRSGWVDLPASQDHKRAYEGDRGPNTGGMGAYAPAPVVTTEVRDRVIDRIIRPMQAWIAEHTSTYRGILFIGLMIDANGDPHVVEFNVRCGDPETQVTFPLIRSDVHEMFQCLADGRIRDHRIEIDEASSVLAVVLASEGYPGSVRTGRPITDTGEDDRAAWVIHAGTSLQDASLISSGGRVLCSVGQADLLDEAAAKAYARLADVHLEGAHHRRDIGHHAGVQRRLT